MRVDSIKPLKPSTPCGRDCATCPIRLCLSSIDLLSARQDEVKQIEAQA